MDELPQEEAERIFDQIGIAANHLNHLPFAQLRKTHYHEFGRLRLWPKLKSFRNPPSWEEMSYRPLVSYRRHRWRKLLAFLSQF